MIPAVTSSAGSVHRSASKKIKTNKGCGQKMRVVTELIRAWVSLDDVQRQALTVILPGVLALRPTGVLEPGLDLRELIPEAVEKVLRVRR
jgi:hypothetical protein